MLGCKRINTTARITHPMAPTKREPSPEDTGKAEDPKDCDNVRNIVKDDRKAPRKRIIFKTYGIYIIMVEAIAMELKTGSLTDYPSSWRQGLPISLTAVAYLSTRKALTFTPAPQEPS